MGRKAIGIRKTALDKNQKAEWPLKQTFSKHHTGKPGVCTKIKTSAWAKVFL
jgi:hypothetical protein